MTGGRKWLLGPAALALAIPASVSIEWYETVRRYDDFAPAREVFRASVPEILQNVGVLLSLSLIGLWLGVLAARRTRGVWQFLARLEVVTGALLSAWLVWTVM